MHYITPAFSNIRNLGSMNKIEKKSADFHFEKISQLPFTVSQEIGGVRETLERTQRAIEKFQATTNFTLTEKERKFFTAISLHLSPMSLVLEDLLQGKTLLWKIEEEIFQRELQKEELEEKDPEILSKKESKQIKELKKTIFSLLEEKKKLLKIVQQREEKIQRLLSRKKPNFSQSEEVEEAIKMWLDTKGRYPYLQAVAKLFSSSVFPFRVIKASLPSRWNHKELLLDREKIHHLFKGYPFKTKSQPIVDVKSYLDHRINHTAFRWMKRYPERTVLFLGTYRQMLQYYKHFEFELNLEYTSTSFSTYYLFVSPSHPEKQPLLIVLNISSPEALKHRLYQMAAYGVDVGSAWMVGNPSCFFLNQKNILSRSIQDAWRSYQTLIKIVFLGNAQLTLNELGYLANPRLKKGKSKGWEALKLHTIKSPACFPPLRYQTISLPYYGRSKLPLLIGAMRMPTGSAAGNAVKTLLQDHRVDYIVMNGSGGSLREDTEIGSYQRMHQSFFLSSSDKLKYQLPNQHILLLNKSNCRKDSYIYPQIVTNGTVNSILEEDENFLTWIKRPTNPPISNIDVETAHIFRAFLEYISSPNSHGAKLIPGIFISDNIIKKDQSLEKRVGAAAYTHLKEFLPAVMSLILNDIKKNKLA